MQPNAIAEGKTQEINIPMYNDMGEAVGKSMDISSLKYDVRIVSGSTLPVNRWAYLEELKQLMQLGVVDDVAVLAETDLKNKENIVKRKSMYAQMQSQLGQMEEALKDKEGTIETLERQLVQAGIKGKVMQATVEINKKKEQVKSGMERVAVAQDHEFNKELMNAKATMDSAKTGVVANAKLVNARANDMLQNYKNNLENSEESE